MYQVTVNAAIPAKTASGFANVGVLVAHTCYTREAAEVIVEDGANSSTVHTLRMFLLKQYPDALIAVGVRPQPDQIVPQ